MGMVRFVTESSYVPLSKLHLIHQYHCKRSFFALYNQEKHTLWTFHKFSARSTDHKPGPSCSTTTNLDKALGDSQVTDANLVTAQVTQINMAPSQRAST